MDAFVTDYNLICRSIRVRDRRRREARRESFRYGTEEFEDEPNIETAVVKALDDFRQRLDGREMILVAFDARAELFAMATLFPGATRLFSSWVDLQELLPGIVEPDPADKLKGN